MAGEPLDVTRARDLAATAGVALVVAYLLVRWNYTRLPVLPRLAGIAAAIVGLAETVAGFGLRRRLAPPPPRTPSRVGVDPEPVRRPLAPLGAARYLAVAKATSLAGAAFGGLWAGLLVYVGPKAGILLAAHSDTVTGVIGLGGAIVMTGGGLWFEASCRRPQT